MPAARNNNPKFLGQKFGRLTVIGFENRAGMWRWVCQCDCDPDGERIRSYAPQQMRNGTALSCGCLGAEHRKQAVQKWRSDYPDLYRKWKSIKNRCYNPNASDYAYYGGRGISVYWRDDYDGFVEYVLEQGWKPGLTIERLDVNGNYEPGNITWATRKEQARNTRRNIKVTYNGVRMSLPEACDLAGADYLLALQRMKELGWSFEDAITVPKFQPNLSTTTLKLVVYNGKTMSVQAACKEAGVPYSRTIQRMSKYGWDFSKAINTPKLR